MLAAIIISYLLYFKYVIGQTADGYNIITLDYVPGLKVLALNCWGMPAKVGSEDKELRMAHIGDMIARAE